MRRVMWFVLFVLAIYAAPYLVWREEDEDPVDHFPVSHYIENEENWKLSN